MKNETSLTDLIFEYGEEAERFRDWYTERFVEFQDKDTYYFPYPYNLEEQVFGEPFNGYSVWYYMPCDFEGGKE